MRPSGWASGIAAMALAAAGLAAGPGPAAGPGGDEQHQFGPLRPGPPEPTTTSLDALSDPDLIAEYVRRGTVMKGSHPEPNDDGFDCQAASAYQTPA